MRSLGIGLVLAVVALAALGFLFKGYLDNNKAADAAAAELAVNKASIAQLNQQNQALEAQINDTKAQRAALEKALSESSQVLPAKLTSSTILREVLNLCSVYKVTALPLSSSDWSGIQILQNSYSVFKANFKLSGQQSDLQDCVQALQNQLYPTLVIENLNFAIPAPVQATPTPSPEPSPSATPEPSATPDPSATPTPTDTPVPAVTEPPELPSADISIAIFAQ
jgi:hypothetical protein